MPKGHVLAILIKNGNILGGKNGKKWEDHNCLQSTWYWWYLWDMRKVHPQVVRLTRVHSVFLYSPRLHFVQRKIRPALCVGQKYTLCGVKNTFHSSLKCGSQPCSRFSCNIQQKTISNILFQKICNKTTKRIIFQIPLETKTHRQR